MNITMTPKEYAIKNDSEFLVNNIELAISQNTLPVGMDIDYALEILKICNEKKQAKEEIKDTTLPINTTNQSFKDAYNRVFFSNNEKG